MKDLIQEIFLWAMAITLLSVYLLTETKDAVL